MNGLVKFLTGAVVGGLAVALLTPMSGEKLRATILEVLKSKDLIPDGCTASDVVEMIAAEIEDKQ